MRQSPRRVVLALCAALMISGCAAPGNNVPRPMVSSVSGAGNTLPAGSRLTIDIAGPWNRMNLPNTGPARVWTMEGLPIDQLLVYSDLKHDQALHATAADAKVQAFKFRSTMQPDEIVALFEGMLTRDGSRFTLLKLEPSPFGTGNGFRFEFELVRRVNHLTLRGVGYGTVSKGELFSMVYVAPRLNFYPRHIATVEKISASARVREE